MNQLIGGIYKALPITSQPYHRPCETPRQGFDKRCCEGLVEDLIELPKITFLVPKLVK